MYNTPSNTTYWMRWSACGDVSKHSGIMKSSQILGDYIDRTSLLYVANHPSVQRLWT